MKQKVIFIHIPKTAGTSVNTLLSYQYGHRKNFWHTTQESWAIAKERFLKHVDICPEHCDLVRGHIPYGWADLTEGDYAYITFVRDPLERAISHYNFAINHGRGIWFDELSSFNNLEDYLCNGNSIGHDNYQLRYLSGTDFQQPVNRMCLEKTYLRMQNEELIVGCLSRMRESVVLMSAVLHWRKPIFNLHYNPGPQRAVVDLPKEVEVQFRERNILDYELHDYARSFFDKMLLKHENAYKFRMKLFKIYGPVFGEVAHCFGNIYRKFKKKVERR